MKPSEKGEPLVTEAIALVHELASYSALTDEVSRIAVNSEKSLARASRAVQEASACQERILQHVGALSAAMAETRERQQRDLERMAEAVQRVHARASTFQALITRYGALAEMARSANERASEISARKAAGESVDALRPAVDDLVGRAAEIITGAGELAEAAREGEFDDLTRAVDGLKQQMESARNRITLAQRTLAERASS